MAMNNEDLARASVKRDKLAVSCSKKLTAAADALTKFLRASNQCYDGTGVTEMDDYRVQLRDEISEFAGHLEREFDKTKTGEQYNGRGFDKSGAQYCENGTEGIANHFQEGLGRPASLIQAIESYPDLLVQPDTLHSSSIDSGGVVRWDRFGHAFLGKVGAVCGWVVTDGYYQGCEIKLDALKNFGTEVATENWGCDIQGVFGVSASKSELRKFTSLDDMVKTNSKEMITPVTEAKLRKNLDHDGIRILREKSEEYFVQYQWDKRIFLANVDGSHHFGAARYIAGQLNIPVPLTGKLEKRSINAKSLSLLLQDFDVLLISDEAHASSAFHNAMRRFLANYFWMPLPREFCSEGLALLLPKSEARSAKVAALLRDAGAFDIGAHLSELVTQQE